MKTRWWVVLLVAVLALLGLHHSLGFEKKRRSKYDH